MSSREKIIKSIIRFFVVSFFAYLSLFYIAPFLSALTSRIFNFGTDIKVTNIVQTPVLINFKDKTNQSIISLEGATSQKVEVELILNNNSYSKTTSEENGRFKFDGVNIIKGKNTIKLVSKDSTGVQSDYSNEYILEYDDTKPQIKEINLKNGDEIKNLNKNIRIIGETNEPSDIEVNGKKVFIINQNKFEYLLGVEEGNVKIEITLKDKAGNEEKLIYNVVYKKG